MANTVSGFYQTLVAAANEASQALVGTTSYLDNVYVNYKPETCLLYTSPSPRDRG